MKKSKKYVLLLFLFLLNFLIGAKDVNAEENIYINKKGVKIENYTEVSKHYPKYELDYYNEEDAEYLTNLDFSSSHIEEMYIKNIIHYDNYGNVDANFEVLFDSEEEINADMEINPLAFENCSDGYACYQTTYKKVWLDVLPPSSSSLPGDIKISCKWLKMPAVRSYDVIALRLPASFTYVNIQGYQKADSHTFSYEIDGANTKKFSNGTGTSMNIYDEVSSTLELTMTARGKYTSDNATPWVMGTIYGTYQHATSDVTQTQSVSYTINSSGLGGVLKFNSSSIASKYDNMKGINYTP